MDELTKQQIVAGVYSGEKVQEFGITHYAYKDCDEKDLVIVVGDNNEEYRLHRICAEAFNRMHDCAKREGIELFVVSGYRSTKEQVEVFKYKFKDKEHPTDAEMEARLKFSAPSGFSEHHTGFAVDINSVEDEFKDDIAYEWLKKNAYKFDFENSFPENNSQNLGFEPWHWRYIGDENTKKIFEKARNNF